MSNICIVVFRFPLLGAGPTEEHGVVRIEFADKGLALEQRFATFSEAVTAGKAFSILLKGHMRVTGYDHETGGQNREPEDPKLAKEIYEQMQLAGSIT